MFHSFYPALRVKRLFSTVRSGSLLFLLAVAGCVGKAPPVSAQTATVVEPEKTVVTTPAPDLATNPPPRVTQINTNLPTIFVAGDSTAARGAGEAQQGWAVP